MNIKLLTKRICIAYLIVVLVTYSSYTPSILTASNFIDMPFLGLKNNTLAELLYQYFGYGIWPFLMLSALNIPLTRALCIASVFQWGVFVIFKNTLWKGIIPYAAYQLLLMNYLPLYGTLPIVAILLICLFFPEIRAKLKSSQYEDDLYNMNEPEYQDTEHDMPVLEDDYQDQPIVTPKVAISKPRPQPVPVVDHASDFCLPPISLLDKKHTKLIAISDNMAHQMAHDLKRVLEEFGIRGDMGKISPGPVVTLYEFIPAPGIKTSRVVSLADDIARSMSALSARIAVVPGQNVIGIELPNKKRNAVYLRDLLESSDFVNTQGGLQIALGQDIIGNPVIVDLAKMPHLLIAGTTGSGKSVGINTMILSLLFKYKPEQCRFVMIDPKMLELSIYDGIPHLLSPVVTDAKKAVSVLKWAVKEMENRYMAMSKLGVRNIDGYNQRIKKAQASGEVLQQRLHTGFDKESGKPIYETQIIEYTTLPYIVIIVDEMADLMMVAGKEIEVCVQRLAQMARAAGLHLIMATQRPSVDVITGTIKANFPTRISFHVTSRIDSRTILGEQGAEQLLGQGDMLYMAGGGKIIRVHGPFASDTEVSTIAGYLKEQNKSSEDDMNSINFDLESSDDITEEDDGDNDPVYKKAIDIIMQEGKVSTSFLQRKLQIGYNRAARIVDQMEEKGVVSAPDHTGKRQILVA